MYELHLNDIPFEQIREGKKTLEARVFDEKRRHLKVGDIITFIARSNEQNTFQAKIVALHQFPTFLEMFQTLPVQKFGWEKKSTAEQAARDMHTYYSTDEEEKDGVVGMELTLLV